MKSVSVLFSLFLFCSTSFAQETTYIGETSLLDAIQGLDSGKLKGPGVLEIAYVGRSLPPEYETLVQRAASRGFQVKGTLLSPEGLENQFIRMTVEMDRGLSEIPISLDVEENEREKIRDHLTPRNRKERFQNLSRKLFGTPYGIAIFSPFRNLFNPKNKGKALYLSLEASVISIPMIYFSIQQLESSLGSALNQTAPLMLHTAWIFSFIYNLESISRLRGQGKTIVTDSSLPPGKQIGVRPNGPTVFASTLALDFFYNMIILSAVFGLDGPVGQLAWKAFLNSALTSSAKTPFELVLTRYIEKGYALVNMGREEEGQRLLQKGLRWEQVASNYFFPALKLFHLLAPAALVASSGFGDYLMFGMGNFVLPILAVLSPLLINQRVIRGFRYGIERGKKFILRPNSHGSVGCKLLYSF